MLIVILFHQSRHAFLNFIVQKITRKKGNDSNDMQKSTVKYMQGNVGNISDDGTCFDLGAILKSRCPSPARMCHVTPRACA